MLITPSYALSSSL